MTSAAGRDGETFRGGALIPVLFFITPLFTAAAPRLAPFFLPIVATVLIIVALRRGLPWRELLRPNAAMAALIAVALYAGLSAIWADRHRRGTALLVAVALAGVRRSGRYSRARQSASSPRLARLRRRCSPRRRLRHDRAPHQRRAHCFAIKTIPASEPDRANYVAIRHGLVTRINVSEFNQHVAMLALQLWPGLWALRVSAPPRRDLAHSVVFLALASPDLLGEYDSSQLASSPR